jgi:hypothetical protein
MRKPPGNGSSDTMRLPTGSATQARSEIFPSYPPPCSRSATKCPTSARPGGGGASRPSPRLLTPRCPECPPRCHSSPLWLQRRPSRVQDLQPSDPRALLLLLPPRGVRPTAAARPPTHAAPLPCNAPHCRWHRCFSFPCLCSRQRRSCRRLRRLRPSPEPNIQHRHARCVRSCTSRSLYPRSRSSRPAQYTQGPTGQVGAFCRLGGKHTLAHDLEKQRDRLHTLSLMIWRSRETDESRDKETEEQRKNRYRERQRERQKARERDRVRDRQREKGRGREKT